jgi:hypothetical protein
MGSEFSVDLKFDIAGLIWYDIHRILLYISARSYGAASETT